MRCSCIAMFSLVGYRKGYEDDDLVSLLYLVRENANLNYSAILYMIVVISLVVSLLLL